MMDQVILVAVEAAFHFGFPLDAEAVLLIEVDGLEAGSMRSAIGSSSICKQHAAPAKCAGAATQRAAAACGSAASRRSARSAG